MPPGSHLIQGLAEKIVVYEPMMLVILTVGKAKISERHVADCYVKEAVGHFHLFKAGHGNIAVLIQLLCNSAGDTIKFHTVGFAPPVIPSGSIPIKLPTPQAGSKRLPFLNPICPSALYIASTITGEV